MKAVQYLDIIPIPLQICTWFEIFTVIHTQYIFFSNIDYDFPNCGTVASSESSVNHFADNIFKYIF